MANKEKFGVSGWEKRPTRRMYIVNGSDLVTAKKQQAFLPVDEGKVILSGEPVSREWGNDEQIFKNPSADSTSIYFANADSFDWDVKGAGKLPAIYCGDDFEVQTAFFDTSKDYKPGDLLYIKSAASEQQDGTAGHYILTNVKDDGFTSEPGNNDKKGDKASVVGVVSKGVIKLGSVSAQNGDIKVDANAIVGGPRNWVNDTGSNVVLQFYTKWIPVQA